MGDSGRRWVSGLAGLALLAAIAVGLLAFRRDPPPEKPERPEPAARVGVHPGTWTAIPSPPLSERWGSVGGWTGREVVVVGGSADTPCLLRCERTSWQRGGAAYDPATRAWRRLPPAPVPVGPGSLAAAVGPDLVVATATRWLRLDTTGDRWTDLPGPGFAPVALVATDDAAYAVDGRRVAALDVGRGVWTRLPDPPAPQSREAVATAYAGGLTLVDGGRVLDRWDGERWTRTTVRVPGRVDPVTGDWQRLPDSPGLAGTSWLGLPETDHRPATSGSGHVWDPVDRVWVGLGSPTSPPRTYATIVYADRSIYVVGGLSVNRSGTDVGAVSQRAWVWTP